MFYSIFQIPLLVTKFFFLQLLSVWIFYLFIFKRASNHFGSQINNGSLYPLSFTERAESRLIAQVHISDWKQIKLTSAGIKFIKHFVVLVLILSWEEVLHDSDCNKD